MDVVKLGKKGQLSIPKTVLNQLGLEGEQHLLLEVTADGALLLRPAGIYPVETYSDARIAEFLDEDRLTDAEAEKLASKLAASRHA